MLSERRRVTWGWFYKRNTESLLKFLIETGVTLFYNNLPRPIERIII